MLFAVGGCDFLRKVAGRPTSAELAVKAELIEQHEAELARREDSLRIARQVEADSLAMLDSVRALCKAVHVVDGIQDRLKVSLDSRYYIVIGSFGDASNARRLAAQANKKGCEAVLLPYKNGTTTVALFPSRSLKELYPRLQEARRHTFCPKDAWVLVNE